jgi:hypothetical protein
MIIFCCEPSKPKTFDCCTSPCLLSASGWLSFRPRLRRPLLGRKLLQIPDLQRGRLYDSRCRTAQNLEGCYGKVDLVVQPVAGLNPDWEHRHSIPHQLPGVVDELCHKTRSCRNQSTPMIEGRRPNARTQNYNYSIATSTNPWIYKHACLPPSDHQSC